MEILRNEFLVALNDLTFACLDAANMHEAVAQTCENPEVSRRLQSLATDRNGIAAYLSEVILEHDDIPNTPADEKAQVESALTRVKAAFSDHPLDKLLEECAAKEAEISEVCERLLRHDLDPELHRRIEQLRRDTASRIGGIGVD